MLVVLERRAFDGLQQDAVRAVALVGEEPVAAQDDALRVHERRTGRVVAEDVALETVVVRVHVVQAVADALDVVVAHLGAVDEREVHAVARVADRVARHDVAGRVPDVDAVAALVLVQRRPRTARPRRAWPTDENGSIGCRTVSRAEDRVALDAHAVGLADVHAVQRIVDAVVDDHGAVAGDVDGRVVLAEVEAGPADLEAVDRDVGRAHGDGVRLRRRPRRCAPGVAVQADGTVDHERPAILPRRHRDRGPRRRCRQGAAPARTCDRRLDGTSGVGELGTRRVRESGLGPGLAAGSAGAVPARPRRRAASARWRATSGPSSQIPSRLADRGPQRRHAAAARSRPCRTCRPAAGWSGRSWRSAASRSRPA